MCTKTEKPDVIMEDVASSHTFMEGKTVSNKTTGKKKMKKILLGNALLCTLYLTITIFNVLRVLYQKTMH
jgi:hypothetical protein